VHDEVVEALAGAADALCVGPGVDEATQVGPLVSGEQLERVRGFVTAGLSDSATEVTRRREPAGDGYFITPTVFADVRPSMRIAREEIFGPVVAVIPFDDEEEAVALANDTEYGLAAGLWTTHVKRAHRLAGALRAGTVWINAYGSVRPTVPFGGFKQSGYGRELGPEALELYTEPKSVFVDVS
jgi:acyl-CoA reductase-like NAD-dependent aldehyde dehydrogenase